MDDKITIRRAAPADIPSLLHLRELMLIELGTDDAKRLEELRQRSLVWFEKAFAEEYAAGWLAELDGELLGGASMTILSTQPQFRTMEGKVASIYGVYVMQEHRGQGVATAVVQRAVDFAREHGIPLATLHAADNARPLYERLGFEAGNEMRLFLD